MSSPCDRKPSRWGLFLLCLAVGGMALPGAVVIGPGMFTFFFDTLTGRVHPLEMRVVADSPDRTLRFRAERDGVVRIEGVSTGQVKRQTRVDRSRYARLEPVWQGNEQVVIRAVYRYPFQRKDELLTWEVATGRMQRSVPLPAKEES